MRIPNEVNDETFLKMVNDRLGIVSARHGHKLHNAEELLGSLSKSQFKLIHAVNAGNGKITTTVLSELVDLVVTAMRGSRAYLHNRDSMPSVHGIGEDLYHEQH